MRTLECVRGRPSCLLLCVWLALSCASPVLAQQWTIDPSVEAQATLTDNANYGNRSQGEGDLILRIEPAVSFLREGPRLKVNGFGSLDIIGYAQGTQTSRIYPQGDILANYEAVERFFFIEAALRANQELLNPFLPQSETASTVNKYTYIQGRIAPYLQGDFGSDWRYLVRSDNSYTYTAQSDVPLSDAYYGRHVAEVVRSPNPLGGSLRVQSDITRFEDSQVNVAQVNANSHLELARATVNYAFTPQLSAGLRGGYERTNYTITEESGSIYGAELLWVPNPRSRLAGFWENRFFGPGYEVEFSNRQRVLASSLSFSRSVTSYPELILRLPASGNVSSLVNAILVARFPDPIERARQAQDLINRQGLPESLPTGVNIYSQGINVVASGYGTLAWIGARNTAALRLYYVKTERLADAAVPPTFLTLNNNTQKGASLAFSHQWSPRVSLNATISRTEVRGLDQAAGNDTDENLVEVQATRQLTPRSSGYIGARYQQWNSTSTTFGDSNEAAIFIGLIYRP